MLAESLKGAGNEVKRWGVTIDLGWLFREGALVIAAEPFTALLYPHFADGELCVGGRDAAGDLHFGDVGDEGGVRSHGRDAEMGELVSSNGRGGNLLRGGFSGVQGAIGMNGRVVVGEELVVGSGVLVLPGVPQGEEARGDRFG